MMRTSPPTLRRRNNAKLREHRRWLIERGDIRRSGLSGYDSDSEDSGNSDAESGPESDSDDEDTPSQPGQTLSSSVSSIPTLTHAVTKPTVSSTLGSSAGTPSVSKTTATAVLPTPHLGLGGTLLAGEGDANRESETDGVPSDGESEDEKPPPPGSAKPPPAKASPPSTTSQSTPTLTAVVPPDHSSTTSTQKPSPVLTSSSGIPTLSTSVIRQSGVQPAPTTTTLSQVPQGTPATVLGPQVGLERSHLGGGAVGGIVLGVVVGVSILIAIGILSYRRLRGEGRDLKSLWPFPRRGSDDSDPTRPKTTATARTWNKNLWGAVSTSGPRTTVSSIPPPLPITEPRYDPRADSDIINHLIQASYNADNNPPQDPNYHPVLTLHKDLNPETPHFPPSPTSFINEKAYNALEGPWPRYAPPTPAKLRRSSKPPAVTRWLDGILTPRLSRARMSRPIPQGAMEGTRWQEDPGLAGMGGLRPPPVRNVETQRETMKTETTETSGSSVVW
ncbi:hypothetical protein DL546_002384 [Coniochaeta pulveracea]|uniref:Uncharacterized protein n=1 Tax=Coniochaeta pulveracea TaxID=177199 RepID=A0A420XWP7_9PEZI|nr:hypothetical protein DL546_002384 [Coniochaeta pulveracea]